MAYKHGAFPFSRPPQHVDPEQTLEHIWKMLHAKDHLKQIWYIMEKGADAYTIAKALLYKMALEGQIQMNLAILIFPKVTAMLTAIGKSKGIDVKIAPKFRDNVKEAMGNDTLNELNGTKAKPFVYPKSALDTMKIPKPEDAKAAYEAKQKQLQMKQRATDITTNIQQNKQDQMQQGIMTMAPQSPVEGQ